VAEAGGGPSEPEIDIQTVADYVRWVACSYFHPSEIAPFEVNSFSVTEPISPGPEQRQFGTRLREFIDDHRKTELDPVAPGPASIQVDAATKVCLVKPRMAAFALLCDLCCGRTCSADDHAGGPVSRDEFSATSG
jgi:hypothetical protein